MAAMDYTRAADYHTYPDVPKYNFQPGQCALFLTAVNMYLCAVVDGNSVCDGATANSRASSGSSKYFSGFSNCTIGVPRNNTDDWWMQITAASNSSVMYVCGTLKNETFMEGIANDYYSPGPTKKSLFNDDLIIDRQQLQVENRDCPAQMNNYKLLLQVDAGSCAHVQTQFADGNSVDMYGLWTEGGCHLTYGHGWYDQRKTPFRTCRTKTIDRPPPIFSVAAAIERFPAAKAPGAQGFCFNLDANPSAKLVKQPGCTTATSAMRINTISLWASVSSAAAAASKKPLVKYVYIKYSNGTTIGLNPKWGGSSGLQLDVPPTALTVASVALLKPKICLEAVMSAGSSSIASLCLGQAGGCWVGLYIASATDPRDPKCASCIASQSWVPNDQLTNPCAPSSWCV